MSVITFTSSLRLQYREALERLLFFNRNQSQLADAISFAIEHYGTPHVKAIGGQLRVALDSGLEPQSLFVLERIGSTDQLVGTVVYIREDDTLVIPFVAVDEEHSHGGSKADTMLLFRILDEVRAVGRRIKGVSSITVFVRGPTVTRLPVNARFLGPH